MPQYPDSGKLGTDVPDVDTGIDWLVYLAQYSQQCQAQSRFVVRSRLDTVKNTEIMACPNQAFYAVLFDRTVVHLEPEYSSNLLLSYVLMKQQFSFQRHLIQISILIQDKSVSKLSP